jgi:hypothetical protein
MTNLVSSGLSTQSPRSWMTLIVIVAVGGIMVVRGKRVWDFMPEAGLKLESDYRMSN